MPRRHEITPAVAILSAASDAAVDALGGPKRAELLTSLGKSQIYRACSSNDADLFSLRDAVAIDRATLGRGGPHILQAYAGLIDHVVIPMPTAPCDHDEISAQILVIAQELGDVSREAMEAQRDGKWTPAEAKSAIVQVNELIGGAGALLGLLKTIAYPGGIDAGEGGE